MGSFCGTTAYFEVNFVAYAVITTARVVNISAHAANKTAHAMKITAYVCGE